MEAYQNRVVHKFYNLCNNSIILNKNINSMYVRYFHMKIRPTISIDSEVHKKAEKLVNNGTFRNISHAYEYSMRKLKLSD